jgi:hypothetical protein
MFATIAGPFFFAKVIESIVIILILILILTVSFALMRIGYVRAACKIFLSSTWIVVTCLVYLPAG